MLASEDVARIITVVDAIAVGSNGLCEAAKEDIAGGCLAETAETGVRVHEAPHASEEP